MHRNCLFLLIHDVPDGAVPDLCRTGFATRPQCFAYPRKQRFRTGLQTPSGSLSLMHMGHTIFFLVHVLKELFFFDYPLSR
ncbi:MAG: hypothetical protein DRI57_15420 [Deltaproteobacteria bacterium]|nr:MAG: hypothetical protein DRI57_15420 [Deltaproteobacteria bacterium]